MERLTKKFKTNYYFNTNHRDIVEKDIEDDFYAAQAMRNKLGQLEDIEERRLSKYKEIGINGLIDLFENLTDEDIEYIIQLAFKRRKIIYDIR